MNCFSLDANHSTVSTALGEQKERWLLGVLVGPLLAGLASQSPLCSHSLVQDGQTEHSINQAERLNANSSMEMKSKTWFLRRSTMRDAAWATSRSNTNKIRCQHTKTHSATMFSFWSLLHRWCPLGDSSQS